MKTSIPATIALISLVFSASRADEAPSGDAAKLQGKWTTTAGPKRDIPVTIEVRGRAVTVDVSTPLGLKVHAEGTLKIDEKAKPKTIDWSGFTSTDGQDLPEVLGIYEIDGDKLKMATGGPNNPRPKEFKAGDGVLADVVTFTRPKSAAPKADEHVEKSSMASTSSSR